MEENEPGDGLKVIEFPSPVRLRPAMYVGRLEEGEGLRNVLQGLLDAVAQGHRDAEVRRMRASIDGSGALVLEDDGPCLAMPRGSFGQESAEELVHRFSNLYRLDADTLGRSLANALSSRLEVLSHGEEGVWRLAFECGRPVLGPTCDVGPGARGNTLRCWPDPSIFPSVVIDEPALAEHLCRISTLYPLLEVTWNGRELGARDGLLGWLSQLADGPWVGPCVLHGRAASGDLRASVALGWRADGAPSLRAFEGTREVDAEPHRQVLYAGLELLAAQLSGQTERASLNRRERIPLRGLGAKPPSESRRRFPETESPVALHRGLVAMVHLETADLAHRAVHGEPTRSAIAAAIHDAVGDLSRLGRRVARGHAALARHLRGMLDLG